VRLQKILKRKSQDVRAAFEKRMDFVELAYISFDFHTPEFMSVAGVHFGDEDDDLWRSLYVYDQTDIASLKKEIDRQLDGMCWYCRVAPADSLDHILPKGQNPIYAVHASNLVPACTSCNRKKGERLNAIERETIYPYGELTQNERWLFAKITAINNQPGVSFFVDFSAVANKRCGQVLATHVREMELCETYSQHFSGLGRSRMVAEFGHLEGASAVRDSIKSILPGYRKRFGPNYYYSVGMEALQQSDDSTMSAFLG